MKILRLLPAVAVSLVVAACAVGGDGVTPDFGSAGGGFPPGGSGQGTGGPNDDSSGDGGETSGGGETSDGGDDSGGAVTGECGDSMVNAGEECDGADFGGSTCSDFNTPGGDPYDSGTLDCVLCAGTVWPWFPALVDVDALMFNEWM